MAQPGDLQALAAAARARLTGAGAEFELTSEQVLGAPTTVLRQRMPSLGEVLRASADWGARDYLITEDRRLSFAEHAAQAAALAAGLRARYGVEKGDRIGILGANTPEWVLGFWAAQALGAIAVGYNAWWMPPEIAYGVGHTEPAVLIVDAKRAALVAELDLRIPVLTMERDVPELIAEYAGAELPEVAVAEDDPSVVIYTSGTSGRPKGAVHTHRNMVAVIDYHRFNYALADQISGARERRFLITSPLFHIASLHNGVVPRLRTGDAAVLYHGAFEADRVLALIERERVTQWGAMPTMATRLLKADLSRYDLSCLTALSLNSAPSSATLQQRLRERIPVARTALVTSYGLTECSTAATISSPAELAAQPQTVGRPVIGADVQIRDADGTRVPDGDEGEIWVRGAYVMLGYWNDAAATAAALTPDRWLRTGDMGTMTDGLLRLSGRRSDLILRGGENVYPVEIEQCLEAHPAVRECAVIGMPDADLGQSIAVLVVVESGTATTEAELRAFAAARLAYYKVPTRWRLTTAPLTRNATGKVVRSGIAV
ncbi:long-chain fatty acid--CoA ligase [Nocardia panacis]|uniref:Long-chain fatty acid--CoA ligase n=1 Tax=Nocardia panacis TaxID=2340916 RepID=A0A3A4KQ35_9NOCA|nr:class I adenylate-forming enzyme family protein [Nocardia panacis]RJO79813.1 long-chain fatty acid--CoA ligase [Nocardia panacis]